MEDPSENCLERVLWAGLVIVLRLYVEVSKVYTPLALEMRAHSSINQIFFCIMWMIFVHSNTKTGCDWLSFSLLSSLTVILFRA
jgi:hypothetical protein